MELIFKWNVCTRSSLCIGNVLHITHQINTCFQPDSIHSNFQIIVKPELNTFDDFDTNRLNGTRNAFYRL